jgi:PAS domain S-box-containing protein
MLLMDPVEGESLIAMGERGAGLDAVLQAVEALGRAYRALHDRGIIHGDPKAAHWFARQADGGWQASIVDFGLLIHLDDPAASVRVERTRIEAALRQNEARFRGMNDASPLGVFVTDPQGDCTYVNPAWLRIAGITSNEARGHGWGRAIHPDDRERVLGEWYAAVKTAPFQFKSTHRFLHADGTQLPFADNEFDGASISLGLHDMPYEIGLAVLSEIKRVVKKDGSILIIDYMEPKKHAMAWLFHPLIKLYETPNYDLFIKKGLEIYLHQVDLKINRFTHVLGIVQIASIANTK